jgi:hypothetical protein
MIGLVGRKKYFQELCPEDGDSRLTSTKAERNNWERSAIDSFRN